MKLKTTLFLFVLPFITFSQTIFKGNISDEIGPLSGANITIKNTRIGTVSDSIGNYEIKVKKTDTLLISYLGYDTDYVLASDKKFQKTVLKGNIALNEVNIVAYGTKHCSFVCRCYGVLVKSETIKNFKSDIITEKLYPNPSRNGIFQLKLLSDYKKVEIQAHNISGKLIKTIVVKPDNKNLSFDLSSYPSGMYIINIVADGKRLSTKKAIRG